MSADKIDARSFAQRRSVILNAHDEAGPPTSVAHAAPAAQVAHVLVVDDDTAVRTMIVDYLSDFEYRVSSASNGRQMSDVIARDPIDLLLLDLRLAGEDGLQIARELRARSNVPIIILTGLKEEADRVTSLELGADDYITKPFSPRELLARSRALLRRSQSRESASEALSKVRAYRFADWELNVRLRRLTSPQGGEVSLSIGEFNLLAAFLASPQRVLSRDALLEQSRLHNADVFDRSIDVQVGRLRKKLDANPGVPRLIRTVRGVGYQFAVAVDVVRA
jgi:two-component system OmpR family response regulator